MATPIDSNYSQAELFHWRNIINEYPEYDMFLAGIFSPFLIDQRRTIAPSSMQTIGCALGMMAITSVFFLPDVVSNRGSEHFRNDE